MTVTMHKQCASTKTPPHGSDTGNAVVLERAMRCFRTKGETYTAVKDISFSARAGEFVALVGPSGCGKSTILQMVSGLQKADAGKVKVFGDELTGINPHMSYMFQQDALLPWKSIVHNVALGLKLRGMRNAQAREQAHAALQTVGLERFADLYPHQLSGGMRRRAAIAQAWIVDPKILLMDEPFSALDVQNRSLIGGELLKLLQGTNKCVLFVTHDLEEAIGLADRVIVLSAGPASNIIGEYEVTLARPRNIMQIRTTPEFVDMYERIWSALSSEVLKSYKAGLRGNE